MLTIRTATSLPERCCFIALIHPIQWTIANPISTDRPAKCQKQTSCVSPGWPVGSTSALTRWRVVLPSCLDRVTSWHLFPFCRELVHMDFDSLLVFCVFFGKIIEGFHFLLILFDFYIYQGWGQVH